MAEEKANKFAPKKGKIVVDTDKAKLSVVQDEKPAKAAKAVAAPKSNKEPKEGGREQDTRKITLLAKDNPKREGSASYERFELYRKAKTVADFLAAGGTTADVRYDEKAGFIKVA